MQTVECGGKWRWRQEKLLKILQLHFLRLELSVDKDKHKVTK